MKIGSLENKPAVGPLPSDRKSPATSATGSSPSAEPSATVELSPAASLLSSAEADPAFDTDKVERMAQAIRDGKFEVNADKIADKLIANARELLSKYSS
jgi:negative regulator of flagellin synthesis FlgM